MIASGPAISSWISAGSCAWRSMIWLISLGGEVSGRWASAASWALMVVTSCWRCSTSPAVLASSASVLLMAAFCSARRVSKVEWWRCLLSSLPSALRRRRPGRCDACFCALASSRRFCKAPVIGSESGRCDRHCCSRLLSSCRSPEVISFGLSVLPADWVSFPSAAAAEGELAVSFFLLEGCFLAFFFGFGLPVPGPRGGHAAGFPRGGGGGGLGARQLLLPHHLCL